LTPTPAGAWGPDLRVLVLGASSSTRARLGSRSLPPFRPNPGFRIHPNPFATDVAFELDPTRHGPVEVSIYDVSGRRLRTLGALSPGIGIGQYRWDGRDQRGREVVSGSYIYRVRNATMEVTGSLVKVR
jgi:hypothetical protein